MGTISFPENVTTKEYWDRWLKSNELDKVDIIMELPIIKGNRAIKKGFEYSTASLLNSYITDLVEILKSEDGK